jgi:hypothetical protein
MGKQGSGLRREARSRAQPGRRSEVHLYPRTTTASTTSGRSWTAVQSQPSRSHPRAYSRASLLRDPWRAWRASSQHPARSGVRGHPHPRARTIAPIDRQTKGALQVVPTTPRRESSSQMIDHEPARTPRTKVAKTLLVLVTPPPLKTTYQALVGLLASEVDDQ